MLLKTSLELKLQPNSVSFIASYSKPYSLISSLEFNTLSLTEDFSYILKPNIQNTFIGTLVPAADQFSDSFFESFKSRNNINTKEKRVMMICDNEEQNYDNIYFLILGSDPCIQELNIDHNSLAMFKFSIEEITENKLENYEKIINQLLSVQKQMKQVFNNAVLEGEKLSKEKIHHYDAIQYFHHENEKDREKKVILERKIKKKYKKIDRLHQESIQKVNLFCCFCNNEKKNVMFLPCGHLEVCKTCLVQNMKIQIDAQSFRGKKCPKCNGNLENILEVSY
ncbi:hypothetical protein SteCoe_35203 [Stentor coeruleus]|uniref:RING-type domain-containing protein n=1 Tax=Stentor coeruleus TaxID=5963 RepID=A0A1R2AT62_9CILI|nr:hypothetical protein SteCoe_35203 [Stentor coeruleus]